MTTRFRVRSGTRESAYVEARTRDLSESGLAIESPSIRVDGIHAYDSMDMVTPTLLDIVLGLPTGTISITGETVRYDKVGEGEYLLGIHIVEMSDDDRARYRQFLETLRS